MSAVSEVTETITAEERERRAEALRVAQASVFLSGFEIGPKEKAHAKLFMNGEISLDQFIRAGRPHVIPTSSHLGNANDSDQIFD